MYVDILQSEPFPLVVNTAAAPPTVTMAASGSLRTFDQNGHFEFHKADNLKIVPDQIAPWVPGGLTTLGTDGFGRSDTRERLRRFFEVDAESTVIATLTALAEKGQLDRRMIGKAIKDLGVDPEKAYPQIV